MTRVRILQRLNWQKKAAKETDDDNSWHHNESPLVFLPAAALSPVSHEEAVKQTDSEGDDESDVETVIYRPNSPDKEPFRPSGFTGEMPRFYPLANEMATLPPPSSALGVLFPGDPVEQVRAQVAQVRLELAKKEEELASAKKSLVEEKEKAKKAKRAKNRAVARVRELEEERQQRAVEQAAVTKEEKWWYW